MQSVAQSLHTCAIHIVATCIEIKLNISPEINDEASATLIRRLLTALVHHCAKPEQFSAIADMLVKKAELVGDDEEALGRLLDPLFVICSVRGGSRLTREFCTSFNAFVVLKFSQRSTCHKF